MIIKASAALRNDYAAISNMAKESNEPISISEARNRLKERIKLRPFGRN